jgi:Ca2+-binding RTX toxin-like protein
MIIYQQGAGDDILIGGLRRDMIQGGNNKDIFLFNFY